MVSPGVPPNLGPLPLQLVLNGDRYDDSETVTSFEAGWRHQASDALSFDLAAY